MVLYLPLFPIRKHSDKLFHLDESVGEIDKKTNLIGGLSALVGLLN